MIWTGLSLFILGSAFGETEQAFNPEPILADTSNHTGCCSYHGGMAGCQNHRMRCADGSLSPRCACVYDALTQTFWLGKALLRVQAIPLLCQLSVPELSAPNPDHPDPSVTVPSSCRDQDCQTP